MGKSFNNSPVSQFITMPEEDVIEEKPVKKEVKPERKPREPKVKAVELPEYVKPESKSKRLNLLIKPSLYEDVKALAEKSGYSTNDFINKVLENYLKGGK